jgi:CheY-like chemotaxis protein
VLLAEDNKINQAIALALLRKAGAEADAVENGAEAVEAAARGGYGLVLMDVQMPVLDGLEAARRIRALSGAAGRVPILAMTAHAMQGDRERCLQAGMDGYLPKPIDPAAFPVEVRRWLAGGRPRRVNRFCCNVCRWLRIPRIVGTVPGDRGQAIPRIVGRLACRRLDRVRSAGWGQGLRLRASAWRRSSACFLSSMR